MCNKAFWRLSFVAVPMVFLYSDGATVMMKNWAFQYLPLLRRKVSQILSDTPI